MMFAIRPIGKDYKEVVVSYDGTRWDMGMLNEKEQHQLAHDLMYAIDCLVPNTFNFLKEEGFIG